MKSVLIGLFLTLAGIAALMLLPSKQTPAPMPWEVTIMADGNSKVFDIHLGITTYSEAQRQLRQYGKTAIFTREGDAPSVEAFFQSINLGGLSAKLILNLAVDEDKIAEMLSHAMEARIQPSGARRYQLNNLSNTSLIKAPIIAISYIPSIRLDEEKIRYRFGDPEVIKQDAENPNTSIWYYPRLGLLIRLNEHEKTILEYSVKALSSH
jgi:hypothetical protein